MKAMNCDICSTSGSGTIVTANQIREAVFKKHFDPFALGLFSSEVMRAAGKTAEGAYQDWLPMVQRDNTDWNLCPRCFAAIRPYLGQGSEQATPSEKPRNNVALTVDMVDTLAEARGWTPEMREIALGPLKAALQEQERKKKSGCFIATAAYGSTDAPMVRALCDFRDTTLARHRAGRTVIAMYALFSPPLARWIGPHRTARRFVRSVLIVPLAWLVGIRPIRADRKVRRFR